MFIRATIFATLIANILASPLSNDLSDQRQYEYLARNVRITVISEHLDDDDESLLSTLSQEDEATTVFPYFPEEVHITNGTEDVNEKDIQNQNSNDTLIEEIYSGNITSGNFTADSEDLITDKDNKSNETFIEESDGNTRNFTADEVNLLDNWTFVSDLKTRNLTIAENGTSRNKRETSQVNMDDVSAIVTVLNKKLGKENTFYFKKAIKVAKGQRYSCKIGLRPDNVVFYHRCIWIGSTDFPDNNEDDNGDFLNDLTK